MWWCRSFTGYCSKCEFFKRGPCVFDFVQDSNSTKSFEFRNPFFLERSMMVFCHSSLTIFYWLQSLLFLEQLITQLLLFLVFFWKMTNDFGVRQHFRRKERLLLEGRKNFLLIQLERETIPRTSHVGRTWTHRYISTTYLESFEKSRLTITVRTQILRNVNEVAEIWETRDDNLLLQKQVNLEECVFLLSSTTFWSFLPLKNSLSEVHVFSTVED